MHNTCRPGLTRDCLTRERLLAWEEKGDRISINYLQVMCYIYSCRIIKLRWETRMHFFSVRSYVSQWGYILDKEQGRRALFWLQNKRCSVLWKHKSCSCSPSSTLGIATPGRNLAGCPTKDILGWTLKILTRSRVRPSASWALKPDLMTPFLNKSISWGQSHIFQPQSLNQRDNLLIHRDTWSPYDISSFSAGRPLWETKS